MEKRYSITVSVAPCGGAMDSSEAITGKLVRLIILRTFGDGSITIAYGNNELSYSLTISDMTLELLMSSINYLALDGILSGATLTVT